MTRRWLELCSILCALAPLGERPAAAHERVACDDLALASIPDTTITLARLNPASTNPLAPEHCEVVGSIGARTGFDGKSYAIGLHLRMPVAWNGRFLFQGGGGVDGFLGDALGSTGPGQTDNAVSRGYAVVSTDGGHQFEFGVPGIGGVLFGVDPQARLDYGYNALDVTTRVAKKIVALHYGKRPRHSYFVGCSNGGRQGMVAAQRFPGHFDGIVAGNPGFNLPKAAIAEAWDSQAFGRAATQVDAGGEPYLPTSFSSGDLALVADAVLAECDALDGLEDGIIDDQPACRFEPRALECPGAKEPTCLAPEQVAALDDVFGGARDSRGRPLYSDWPYDAGIDAPGWRVWKLGFPAAPGQPLVNNAINLTLGASALPYVFMTPPDLVAADGLVSYMFGFDFDRDAPRIFETTDVYTEFSHEFMTAASTDLERFARLGNKLIVYHGVSDPVFSAHDTLRWYRRLMRRTHGRADRFARLFLIPGMNHCGGGPATDRFDALSVVVDWVERGRAPDAIAASANPGSPWPGRTRPLCAFPRQARYLGQGDVDDAASFVCKAPAHARLPRRAKGHRRDE